MSPFRGQDLNLRPLGYEPSVLPSCTTPGCVQLLEASGEYEFWGERHFTRDAPAGALQPPATAASPLYQVRSDVGRHQVVLVEDAVVWVVCAVTTQPLTTTRRLGEVVVLLISTASYAVTHRRSFVQLPGACMHMPHNSSPQHGISSRCAPSSSMPQPSHHLPISSTCHWTDRLAYACSISGSREAAWASARAETIGRFGSRPGLRRVRSSITS